MDGALWSGQGINIAWAAGILIGLLVPGLPTVLQWVFSRKKNIRKNFRIIWRWGVVLKRKDLLIGRPRNKYYLEREIDKEIREAVKARKNVIVIGKPVSGKTRAVYEAIKKRGFWRDVLVTRHEPIEIDTFSFPIHFRLLQRKFLIIDDLHMFVGKQNFHYVFEEADKKGISIIATCRSGEDFENAKKALEEQNLTLETVFADCVFELGTVSKEMAQEVAAKTNKDWDSVEFDGTVGSVLMGVGKMRNRYRNELTNEERDILQIMKKMYLTGVYVEDYVFPCEWVKTGANSDGIEKQKWEWDKTFKRLTEYEFLTWYEGRLKGEEVYFEKVIELPPEADPFAVWREMMTVFADEPEVLLRLGDRAFVLGEFDINKATFMKIAIEAYKRTFKMSAYSQHPERYAQTNYNLGKSYGSLGEVDECETTCLLGVDALEKALKIYTLNDFPRKYASVQSDLGTIYQILYGLTNNEDFIHLAVKLYKEALDIEINGPYTKGFATTISNLGHAFWKLGKYQEAIDTLDIASRILTIEDSAFYHAVVKSNLGGVYLSLSEIENKADNCRKAIVAYKQALGVYNSDEYPVEYARAQNNLGVAYKALSTEEDISINCIQAIAAHNEALNVYNLDCFPAEYAMTQQSLALAYGSLGEFTDNADNYSQAANAYSEVLKVRTRHEFPKGYAMVMNDLGVVYKNLGKIEDKALNCQRALDCYIEAYRVYEEQGIQTGCSIVEHNIELLKEFCVGVFEVK